MDATAGAGDDDDGLRALAAARVGRTLGGRLRLERVLGIGGTGTVYAARHRNGRAFAVKVLHPEFARHAGMRARFLAEGYAANKVDHPGAVAVLDDGEDADGSLFLVMELLQGRTLAAERTARGTLPPAEVVRCTLSVLDVLARAHEQGVLHRDVKPSNIFVTDDGAVKLLDFGTARVEDSVRQFATRPGVALGTPAFMAPEVAAGKSESIDALTDVWSIGATMFQLLSGEAVHAAASVNELLVAAATQPARSLAATRPGVAPWLAAIVDRALAFERRERWPNARSFRAALARGAEQAGLLAATPSAVTPNERAETLPEPSLISLVPVPARPRPSRFWLAIALALLVVAAVALFVALKPAPSATASTAQAEALTATLEAATSSVPAATSAPLAATSVPLAATSAPTPAQLPSTARDDAPHVAARVTAAHPSAREPQRAASPASAPRMPAKPPLYYSEVGPSAAASGQP